MQDTGFTGYLLRILETGTIGAGDTMTLIDREAHGITVASAGRTISVDRNDLDAARTGSPVNRPVVAAIAAATHGAASVQTGGGVRSVADERGLTNWPAIRPIFSTGSAAP